MNLPITKPSGRTARALIALAPGAALLAILLSGCAGRHVGSLDPGVPLDRGTALRAEDVYRPGPASRTYRVTEGDAAYLRREITAPDNGVWTLTTEDGTESRTLTLRLCREGDVQLLRMRAPAPRSDAEASYHLDPPLTLAPAILEIGKPVRHESTIRIDEPRRRSPRTGTAEAETELLGWMEDETSGRPVAHVRTLLRFRIAPAVIERRTDWWIDPEAGIVAERLDLLVTAFGMPIRRAGHVARQDNTAPHE